jgi:hypothetical protein
VNRVGLLDRLKARMGGSKETHEKTHSPEDIAKGADIDPLLKHSDVTLSPEARALLRRAKEDK